MFISRLLSILVAVAYGVAAYAERGGGGVFACAAFLTLPLACIWFSDVMGELAAVIRFHQVTAETPGWLVACGGWLVLLAPVAAAYLQQQVERS